MSAAVGLGGGVLASCGGANDTESPASVPSSTDPPAADPPATVPSTSVPSAGTGDDVVAFGDVLDTLPRGGELLYGVGASFATLDMFNELSRAVTGASPVHDFLECYDHNGVLTPSLARQVEVDGNNYTYTLHEGATFHDGTPVTSQSVKDIFEWILDPVNASVLATQIANVTVEVVDDLTLTLVLPAPNAALRASLTRIPIAPVSSVADQATKPVGCGPFIFKRWEQGSYIEYARNPDYWNPDAPRLDALRIVTVPDGTAVTQALLAGQVDFAGEIPAELVPDVRRRADDGELTLIVADNTFDLIGFNCHRAPFDDPRVRRAISLTIDREEIALLDPAQTKQVMSTMYTLSGPDAQAFESLEFVRDLAQARALLAEAGMEGGFSDSLLVVQGRDAAAAIIQANLAEVGIDVTIEVVDQAGFADRVPQRRDYSILLSGYRLDPELAIPLTDLFSPGSPNGNRFNYESPEFEGLMVQARSTVDRPARFEVYAQILEMVHFTDAVMFPTTSNPFVYACSPNTNGEMYHDQAAGVVKWRIAAIEHA